MDVVNTNFSTIQSATPTITANAYTSGFQLGGLMTLQNAIRASAESLGGVLLTVSIVDKDKQNAPIDFYFFKDTPTVASADFSAADISQAQMNKNFIGRVSVGSGDYTNLLNCSEATHVNCGLNLHALRSNTDVTNQVIYVLAVVRGTPTYSTTGSLKFNFHILQD